MVNICGLIMKVVVVLDVKVCIYIEDGVLYVMGCLNGVEIIDLN